ncbi:ABC transporter ATP-binding protein [Anaerotignum lactatifermentans]|uniref:ABC transporter ATP-binding protein n=1 Tax=Anaerotignum lactatifermentans TaxID=160404 RepID=A0ABS2G6B7_9FIRM|nr:ATP-binding cassette domain-containing protein [Anaerotignum lactatifermentans]MBM6828170.1 ABC transporter ATP-binding protein [Anaerotignum lactatifermentans]MBM6876667.1 ABC transporter ATP-binding protein [Anaerotignum lactatifermentans]MBM6949753.1 ABC transporter ATP-binding protein [Anaerotignum lactatifermentans]
MIRISHLEKAFGDKKVFADFSLDISEGETLCLMAASGRGKTTLFRILLGLEQKDGGTITGLEGKRLSAVFQEDRLLPEFTVKENLYAVCVSQKQKQSVREILKAFGLEEWMGKKVSVLSGGMMRRVAIARALLPEFDMLILDEPFQGLDENTRKTVADYVKEAAKGKTVLAAIHDEADACLLEGKILEI